MARNGDPRRGDDTGTHIITKTRPKTKRPSLYKVLLLNDDYTPMDFVVYVLERIAPTAHAESWDNVGLLCGDPSQPIERALLTIAEIKLAKTAQPISRQGYACVRIVKNL